MMKKFIVTSQEKEPREHWQNEKAVTSDAENDGRRCENGIATKIWR